MRARIGAVAALLASAALSCAALIGIEDRLPDDGAGDASAPERGELPADDAAVPDAPVTVDGGPPTYGVGDGHTGSLTVAGTIVVNSYAPLSAEASNTNKVTFANVRGTAFGVGDLVIIWQTAAAAPVASSSPINLAQANVGQWEVARVVSATATELTFDHPIGVASPYAIPGAQIVRVPEYTDLTLPVNTDIHAQNWDGTSGGIVALYVKGTLKNDGAIQANGSGFRGGVGTVTGSSPTNCKAADGIPANGFAHKGEGLVTSAFGDAGGLGNATIGAGGGDCYNAGGGGGGNGGSGGQGGFSGDGDRDVGGRGGAAVTGGSLLGRLTMGGGGAGEVDNGRNISGGQGGGVVLVRAQDIVLPGGKFGARGGSPGKADQSGGAGGGAGGSILVQAAATVGCQLVSVLGGSGASLELTNNNNGPGGGGGGGRVLVQGDAIACAVEVKGGSAGHDNTTNTGATHGATPLAGAEASPPFAGLTELISSAYCATCP